MKEPRPARILQPVNRLKQKVGSGPAELPAAAPDLYRGLMEETGRGYSDHLDVQLRDLRRLASSDEGAGDEGAGDEDVMEEVFTIAHQIRGEAQMFGFGAVGRVAEGLCSFIEHARKSGMRSGSVLALHADAMVMIKNACDTEGVAAAEKLLRTLAAEMGKAVRHVLAGPGKAAQL